MSKSVFGRYFPLSSLGCVPVEFEENLRVKRAGAVSGGILGALGGGIAAIFIPGVSVKQGIAGGAALGAGAGYLKNKKTQDAKNSAVVSDGTVTDAPKSGGFFSRLTG